MMKQMNFTKFCEKFCEKMTAAHGRYQDNNHQLKHWNNDEKQDLDMNSVTM